jgi:hypothetical protein
MKKNEIPRCLELGVLGVFPAFEASAKQAAVNFTRL